MGIRSASNLNVPRSLAASMIWIKPLCSLAYGACAEKNLSFRCPREIVDESFIRSIAMRLSNRFVTLLSVILLASLLGCAGTSTKEGTGEYFDDTVITSKVKAAIFDEPSLKSAQVNVETFKGTVQLSGFVNSRADINKATEVARSVPGVTSVRNDMRLK